MLEKIKEEVCRWNKELPKHNLVKWTSGNVSYKDPETNLVVIKPSGVMFDDLEQNMMSVVDLEGNVIEGDLKPSVDTKSHLYVYKHTDGINSIVHTHSPFATSFAIRGKNLDTYTTTAANMFKRTVKCTDFAIIGEEEIGKQIVENYDNDKAMLLRNHGVFTFAETCEDAVKNAVLLEEVAEYTHYALLHQDSTVQPLDQEAIEKSNEFYKNNYGQKN